MIQSNGGSMYINQSAVRAICGAGWWGYKRTHNGCYYIIIAPRPGMIYMSSDSTVEIYDRA